MDGNRVLPGQQQRSPSRAAVVEERSAQRVRRQRQAYEEELRALVQAAFAVVGRAGTLDAPVRDILTEAGLSEQAFHRHVASKDELLLLMLDQGRRSLGERLEERMAACGSAPERLASWIRGVLGQGRDEESARRTRPFIAQLDRLADRFPEEQRRTEDLLVDQLATAAGVPLHVATAIFDLTFAALARHLRRGTIPTERDAEVLIAMAQQFARREG